MISSVLLLLCIAGALSSEPEFFGRLPRKPKSASLGIYNGKKANIKQFKYLASLEQNDALFGSAIILNNRWLLTVGWTVSWISIDELSFRVGSSFYDKQGQLLTASKVIVHPNYTGYGWDYDMALVKTVEKIKFGKDVKPITLSAKSPKAGTKGWTAGWGEYDSTYIASEQLLKAQATVYDRTKCMSTYGSYLTDRLFCTLDQTTASCSLDAGDPLVMGNKVVGLFAGGYACSPGNYPTLYTDVSRFISWIQSTIKGGEEDDDVSDSD